MTLNNTENLARRMCPHLITNGFKIFGFYRHVLALTNDTRETMNRVLNSRYASIAYAILSAIVFCIARHWDVRSLELILGCSQ